MLQGHPNIVQLFKYSFNPCSILMEYCANGDLRTVLNKYGVFPEPIIRAIFVELLDGLSHIHQTGFVHKDVKLENLFLTSAWVLRIGDFGSALQKDVCDHTRGMTDGYAPPEAHTGSQFSGQAADLFAAGVVLYILAAGRLPFRTARPKVDPNYTQLCIRAKSQTPKPPILDLIDNMLVDDVTTRYTIHQVRQHPWLSGQIATYEEKSAFFANHL
jgi:serine/threonine protein kinase